MNYKNLSTIKKFRNVIYLNTYFSTKNGNFLIFKTINLDKYVKFYLEKFFSGYMCNFFFLNMNPLKKNVCFQTFKKSNFLLIKFKDFDYLYNFLVFDYKKFSLREESLILLGIKIKKNFLSIMFIQHFESLKSINNVDYFVFYIFFLYFYKKIFFIKLIFYINFIFLKNINILCLRFINQLLN